MNLMETEVEVIGWINLAGIATSCQIRAQELSDSQELFCSMKRNCGAFCCFAYEYWRIVLQEVCNFESERLLFMKMNVTLILFLS